MKILINSKKKIFNIGKNFNILNLFFNFADLDDELYFIFYDIFLFNKKVKFKLFKPYGFSFLFKFHETKKWFIARLLNKVNNYNNKNIFINSETNILLWENWNKNQNSLFNYKIKKYFVFKNEIFLFTFKEYYYFFRKNNNNIYFLNSNNFFLKYYNNTCIVLKNNIYYYLIYGKFYFKFIKLNNSKFIKYDLFKNTSCIIIIILQNYIFSYFFKILNNFLLNNIFVFDFNFYFIYNLLEEKQKKEFFLYFITKSKFYLEFCLFLKNRFRFHLRQRTCENKIFKKLNKIKELSKLNKKKYVLNLNERTKVVWFKQKKRRTKNQIYLSIVKRNRFKKKFIFNLNYFIKNNINLFVLNSLNSFNLFSSTAVFFKKYFFKFMNKKNNVKRFNLDLLYVYYLSCRYRNPSYYKNLLNSDDDFDLWFSEDDLDTFKAYDLVYVNFINNLGNITNFNKIDINTIYNLILKPQKVKKKKYIFFFKNIISLLKLKKNYLEGHNFLNLFLNLYFWLIFFFLLIKKSLLFRINKFLDYTSFIKIIDIIYKNNFNLYSISDFVLNLYILTFDNIVIKLSCKFKLLLQEICLYFFFFIFKFINYNDSFLNILSKKNLYNNLLKLKVLNKFDYICKGNLSLDNNFTFCLNLIKEKIGTNSLFFYLIQDFFFNCHSLFFIKKYIKFYKSLLDLTYLSIDFFINNLLFNFDKNKELFYFRYQNVVIIGLNNTKENIQFLLMLLRLIFLFLYFFLRFYFFFFKFYCLNKTIVEIFNYILYKKNNIVFIESSIFSVYNILIFYNFIKIKNKKIIINSANYLLNYSLIKIYNFFFNILNEIKFYFFFLKKKNIKFFSSILMKACYLTMYLKLQIKNKKLNLKYFKKKFKFIRKSKNFYINNKDLKFFLKKNKKINIYNLNLFLKYLK